MRSVMFIGWALLAVSCAGKGDDNACPRGTKELPFENLPGERYRSCMRPDGTLHGPSIQLLADGRARRLGMWVDGKKHGRWRLFNGDERVAESRYVDGELRWHVFMNEGRLLWSSGWKAGLAHGPFVDAWDPSRRIEGAHVEGRRSGTWRRSGEVPETWTYDAAGVMRTLDGRPVPPPPDEIVLLDGTTRTRASCGLRQLEGGARAACVDLFEAFQRCARAPAAQAACQRAALEDFAWLGQSTRDVAPEPDPDQNAQE